MTETGYTIKPIGVIRSDLAIRQAAPHQGFEGGPDAWIEMNPMLAEGLVGISAGDEYSQGKTKEGTVQDLMSDLSRGSHPG